MRTKGFIVIPFLLFLAQFISIQTIFGQDYDQPSFDIGIEFQAYPTGLLPGIRGTFPISTKDALHLRVGLNLIDHRDLGENDDETGSGFGFSIGYEHYFGENLTRWFLGARTDFWFNSINWKNDIGQPNQSSGNTEITVFQPTAIGGYLFEFSSGNLIFAPSLGFGFEINIKENGREVGEGPIFLIGFTLAKRFRKTE